MSKPIEDVDIPAYIEEFGIRHGVPEFAKQTYVAGYRAALRKYRAAIAERDAAYRRGQEDMRREAVNVIGDYPDDNENVRDIYTHVSQIGFKELPND